MRRRTVRVAGWCAALGLLVHAVGGVLPVDLLPAADAVSSVRLVDDRGGAALFTSTRLAPGRVQSRCVALSVTGDAASFGDVGLSVDLTQAGLAPYLSVTVERGTLADPARCASFSGGPVWSGTLAQLPRSTATGIPTGWRPGTVSSMVYRLSVSVLDDPRAQDLGAAAAFVWSLDVEPAPTPVPSPERSPAPVPDPEPVPAPPADPTESAAAAGTTSAPRTTTPAPTSPAAPSTTAPTTQPAPTTAGPTGSGSSGADGDGSSSGDGGDAGDVVQAPPLQASPESLAEVAAALGATALAVADDGQFPLALVAVVVGFLAVQGRLDRRDPKLALARVRQELTDFQDFPERPRTASP